MSRKTRLITHIMGLITLLMTTSEPPSTGCDSNGHVHGASSALGTSCRLSLKFQVFFRKVEGFGVI